METPRAHSKRFAAKGLLATYLNPGGGGRESRELESESKNNPKDIAFKIAVHHAQNVNSVLNSTTNEAPDPSGDYF